MCAVSILVGLHGITAGSYAGTVFTRLLRFSIRAHISVLLYSEYSTLPWRTFYQTPAKGCIETKFHHNICTQRVVSLHGGHVVPSALRSSTATVKTIVVWNSWSRCCAPHMRENLLAVRVIRKQKATPPEDGCTDHPVCCIVGDALGLELLAGSLSWQIPGTFLNSLFSNR